MIEDRASRRKSIIALILRVITLCKNTNICTPKIFLAAHCICKYLNTGISRYLPIIRTDGMGEYSDAEKGCNNLLHKLLIKSKIDFCRSKLGDTFWPFLYEIKSPICLRLFLKISALFSVCKHFYKGFSEGREHQIFLFLMCLCTKRTKN